MEVQLKAEGIDDDDVKIVEIAGFQVTPFSFSHIISLFLLSLSLSLPLPLSLAQSLPLFLSTFFLHNTNTENKLMAVDKLAK